MSLISWDISLATGISTIDDQHKKLIALINDLHEAMRLGKAKEAVSGVLKELSDYTVYHFAFEERNFSRLKYERQEEQAKSHRYFESRLDELKAKGAKGELFLSVEVMDFLLDWVKKHIVNEDMRYVPFFKDKEFI